MSVFIGYPSFMAYQMMKGKKGNNDGFPSIPGMIARYSALGLTNEQKNWKPSLETASLWKRVDEEHAGTKDDPIPYAPPMEIFKDKYYTQSRVLYKCIRDSGQPLSHNLSDLVGNYVEKA